jgi:MFS family permease
VTTSIETRASWTAAFASLGVLCVTYGAPLMTVVALKPIAAEMDLPRSAVSLASSLLWLGTGVGGIVMGWLAERIGIRRVGLIGGTCIALGMFASAWGGLWGLYIGHGLLLGLIGNGCFQAPLMVYVTRWFDRRCGTALALIMGGQYVGGAVWPPLFERGIEHFGWRWTMTAYGTFEALVVVTMAAIFLHAPPRIPAPGTRGAGPMPGARVLGMRPNLVQALMMAAIFLCCIPMALPTAHLVAFCTDLGFSAAIGAAMLSVLQVAAFFSRQLWGWVADRVGGLPAVLLGSACQAATLALFLATQDETGLFFVAGAFGIGFAGIVPGYYLAIRELYPAGETSWRMPTLSFSGLLAMATGAWAGGAIYDHFGSYAPAFAAGVAANVLNLVIVGFLVSRVRRGTPRVLAAAAV